MTKSKRTRYQVLGLISLSLVVAAATYGFAEVNAVNSAGIMGVGYGVLSEHEVSRVTYTLDVSNPTSFTAVSFEVDGGGGALLAGVSPSKKGAVIWADECHLAGPTWTCTFGESIDVLVADWLHVTELK